MFSQAPLGWNMAALYYPVPGADPSSSGLKTMTDTRIILILCQYQAVAEDAVGEKKYNKKSI